MIQLTPHQNEVANQVLQLLSTEKFIIINGKAGTGKTTMVDELVCRIKPTMCMACAPTNKAVKVLASKLVQAKEHCGIMKVNTLHSALKLGRSINHSTGEIKYTPKHDKNPLMNFKLLIVDEVSMVGSELLDFVELYAKEVKDLKVLFIGDPTQLNPVEETETPAFTRGYSEVNLLEIVRQGKDNPIIQLSRNLGLLRSQIDNYFISDGIKGYIFDDRYDLIVQRLAEANGTDAIKFLCWTNAQVDKMNRIVRKTIYGEDPDVVMVGESLVMNAPYLNKYFTKDEVRVQTVSPVIKNISLVVDGRTEEYNFDCLKVNEEILCLTSKGKTLFDSVSRKLKSQCKEGRTEWSKYYEFVEEFADFTYNHAMTVHSAQGSTYKIAVLYLKDMMKNRDRQERERLLYTAVTRASNLVIIYNG